MPKNKQLNVCSWHAADTLTGLKVRGERIAANGFEDGAGFYLVSVSLRYKNECNIWDKRRGYANAYRSPHANVGFWYYCSSPSLP